MTGDTEGVVLRIERTSIHDGSGLRTVLFLKGCPLACLWCSTPESQNPRPEKGYDFNRCHGCGTCVANCPERALSLIDGTLNVDPTRCTTCFQCVASCPHEVHKGYGQVMSVSQVMAEISKDEIFYFHSGGGVTLSGGECFFQPKFTMEILKQCHLQGIDTAVETSLQGSWQHIEKSLHFLNSMYVDIKHPEYNIHRELTTVNNATILDNLSKADRSPIQFDLHIRIPLIPGINDGDETLRQMISITNNLQKIKDIEILPYHRLGSATYRYLSRNFSLDTLQPPSQEYLLDRANYLLKQDISVPLKLAGNLFCVER